MRKLGPEPAYIYLAVAIGVIYSVLVIVLMLEGTI